MNVLLEGNSRLEISSHARNINVIHRNLKSKDDPSTKWSNAGQGSNPNGTISLKNWANSDRTGPVWQVWSEVWSEV